MQLRLPAFLVDVLPKFYSNRYHHVPASAWTSYTILDFVAVRLVRTARGFRDLVLAGPGSLPIIPRSCCLPRQESKPCFPMPREDLPQLVTVGFFVHRRSP